MLEIINREEPYAECKGVYSKIAKLKLKGTPPRGLLRVTHPLALNFIEVCTRINPEERPNAEELLEHPFLISTPEFDDEEVSIGNFKKKLSSFSLPLIFHIAHDCVFFPIITGSAPAAVGNSDAETTDSSESPQAMAISLPAPAPRTAGTTDSESSPLLVAADSSLNNITIEDSCDQVVFTDDSTLNEPSAPQISTTQDGSSAYSKSPESNHPSILQCCFGTTSPQSPNQDKDFTHESRNSRLFDISDHGATTSGGESVTVTSAISSGDSVRSRAPSATGVDGNKSINNLSMAGDLDHTIVDLSNSTSLLGASLMANLSQPNSFSFHSTSFDEEGSSTTSRPVEGNASSAVSAVVKQQLPRSASNRLEKELAALHRGEDVREVG